MPLHDRAANVLERLIGNPELLNSPITLVCHSFGGLVAKQVLREANDWQHGNPAIAAFLANVQQIVFIATPHSGSYHANWLDLLKVFLWPSWASRGLMSDDPYLRNLNNWYRMWSSTRGIEHLSFYESHETVWGKVVSESSAAGLTRDTLIPLDANHVGISKPFDRKDQIYESVKRFVVRNMAGDPSSSGPFVRAPISGVTEENDRQVLPRMVRIAAFAFLLFVVGSYALRGASDRFAVTDIYRVVDYSEVRCNSDGTRNDVVTVSDTIAIASNPLGADFLNRQVTVEPPADVIAYDLNTSENIPVRPMLTTKLESQIERTFRFTIVHRYAKIKWVWRNSGADDGDTVGSLSRPGWRVRGLTIEYKPPVGVEMEMTSVSPPSAVDVCFFPKPNLFVCPELNTEEEISISWQWDAWRNCPRAKKE